MYDVYVRVALNLAAAWAAGSLIGAERTYNGRAAGFRTHALVGLAAAAAMTTAMNPPLLNLAGFPPGDATRVTQGVMTGVGFLGAGVIFKEGVSVQGLTTAACIWTTAAVGLLFGAGLFIPGLLVTLAVLTTLIGFRALEAALPGPVYVLATFRFDAKSAPREEHLIKWLDPSRVRMFDISTSLVDRGEIFEFRGNLRIRRLHKLSDLTESVQKLPGLIEFNFSRIGK
jgi:putative Mg2+ transporter-C (MgtC) family protein